MSEHDLTLSPGKHEVLEEAGVGFDPAGQHMDLSKEEKRRTTALLMAIQAYKNLIIPDAAYLREAADMARRDEGPKIHPATIDAMVVAAIKFDTFIAGGYPSSSVEDAPGRPSQVETDDTAGAEAQPPNV